jgi:hypothetical protein
MVRFLAFLLVALSLTLGPLAGWEGGAHAHQASAGQSHHCDDQTGDTKAKAAPSCPTCPCANGLTTLLPALAQAGAAVPGKETPLGPETLPSGVKPVPPPRPPRA